MHFVVLTEKTSRDLRHSKKDTTLPTLQEIFPAAIPPIRQRIPALGPRIRLVSSAFVSLLHVSLVSASLPPSSMPDDYDNRLLLHPNG